MAGLTHRLANTGTLLTKTYFDEYSQYSSGSLYFNGGGTGSPQYLSVPSTGLGLSGNLFTIEGWFYPTDYGKTGYSSAGASFIISTTNTSATGGGNNGFQLAFDGVAGTSLTRILLYLNNGTINSTFNYAFSLNNWYHIACVRNTGGVFTIYVNGTSIGTVTNATTWTDNSPYTIARSNQGGYERPFTGYVSNFRIIIGTALYTANFTPPTMPLSFVANTKLLLPTYNYNPFGDYTSNNVTLTVTGGVTANTFTPFSTSPKFTANSINGQLNEVSGLVGPKIRMSNTGIITITGSGQFDEYNTLYPISSSPPMIATAANTATYYNASAQIGSQDDGLVIFDENGSYMYVNSTVTRTFYQYTLSTAWDVTTATYTGKSLNHSAQTTGGAYNSNGARFKIDGTVLYIQAMGNARVYQYNLGTAWDLSTATYSGNSYLTGQSFGTGFDFATDGKSFYICDPIVDGVYQYKCSTPWNITTATFYVRYDTTSQLSVGPQSIRWFGPYAFYVANQGLTTYQFKTTVAWDCTAANVTLIGNGGPPAGEIYFKYDATQTYFAANSRIWIWTTTPGNP